MFILLESGNVINTKKITKIKPSSDERDSSLFFDDGNYIFLTDKDYKNVYSICIEKSDFFALSDGTLINIKNISKIKLNNDQISFTAFFDGENRVFLSIDEFNKLKEKILSD